jgi:hypothetical protein
MSAFPTTTKISLQAIHELEEVLKVMIVVNYFLFKGPCFFVSILQISFIL